MAMDEAKDLIVLVHGFGARRLVMWPFACLLRARGFRVRFWSYGSLFDPIEKHAIRFYDYLHAVTSTERRFHIVAHSMGCIVTQSTLNLGGFTNLGRIVLLAPPNAGSPIARIASKVIGRLIPPTRELSDTESSYVNKLERNPTVDVGIIAARFDALVPIRSTHLPNEKAHVVINATHNSLLLSIKASKLTARFLAHGSFEESTIATASL